jgi:hypothetical protein
MAMNAIDRPIYESSEGPIIKGKQINEGRTRYNDSRGANSIGRGGKTGKSGVNMIMSGESFGMNPLRSGKGALVGDSKVFDKRERI